MKSKIIIVVFTFLSLCILFYLFMIRYDILSFFQLRSCIVWSKNVKVEIKDYEMEPSVNSYRNYFFWNGIFIKSNGFGDVQAKAVFRKDKSWVKHNVTINYKELVKLQKLSFDLAEVHARILSKNIKYSGYGKKKNKLKWDDLEKYAKIVCDEYRSIDDSLVNDKTKSTVQILKYWRPKIDKMLSEH